MCLVDRQIHAKCGHFRKLHLRAACEAGFSPTSQRCLATNANGFDLDMSPEDITCHEFPVCPPCYRRMVDEIDRKYEDAVEMMQTGGLKGKDLEWWKRAWARTRRLQLERWREECKVWADG